jgi:hypothetical protein
VGESAQIAKTGLDALAMAMLALLAIAGGAQILVVVALAFLLAATWKIWVWLGLMGIVVLHHPPRGSL